MLRKLMRHNRRTISLLYIVAFYAYFAYIQQCKHIISYTAI